MLPSIRALKPAVECASPCPLAAGVSAAVTALSDDMEVGLSRFSHCTMQERRRILPAQMHRLARNQASDMQCAHGLDSFARRIPLKKSNSYLRTDLDHPPRRD